VGWASALPAFNAATRSERRRAYERDYYHTKAKEQRAAYSKATLDKFRARRAATRKKLYWSDPERFRAAARMRMREAYRKKLLARLLESPQSAEAEHP